MALKPVIIRGFKGMNNLPREIGRLLDIEKQVTPRIVLNADITDGGAMQRRGGYALTVSLTNAHSLWAGSFMLCVADAVSYPNQALYRVEGAQALELCEITGPRQTLNYEEIGNLIYISNPYWQGVYDPVTEAVRSWGVPLPLAPDISLVDGLLPPGAYSLCYTNVDGTRIGGNGPITQVKWFGEARGIQLNNRPSGALTWITHPNGGKLFQAPVSSETISALVPNVRPLQTQGVYPPPGFSHFTYAFGRIWGARGKQVFYSDPFEPEWFRRKNFLPFQEDIIMLAQVTGGLFVNSLKNTWFLDGQAPDKMQLRHVGNGAIPGTLAYVQLDGSHLEISKKEFKRPSPVWLDQNGIVAGNHTGFPMHISYPRLHLSPRTKGAGFYRVQNGVPQVVMSLRGVRVEDDAELTKIFEEGKLFD